MSLNLKIEMKHYLTLAAIIAAGAAIGVAIKGYTDSKPAQVAS